MRRAYEGVGVGHAVQYGRVDVRDTVPDAFGGLGSILVYACLTQTVQDAIHAAMQSKGARRWGRNIRWRESIAGVMSKSEISNEQIFPCVVG